MIFTREQRETWTAFQKIGFRFLFIYFSFYCFCLIGSGLFKPLVHWVGDAIFHISYDFSIKGYGSGDTTYQYLLLFIIASFSVIGTLIWTLFDRRPSYNQLAYTLRLLLRFTLIPFLFIYGFIKVFHLQMPPPDNTRLMQTLGEMSPMGLAWTFMGYSKAYSIFAGLSEVIAGLLLISRRLQAIGAIVLIAVMGNVFMMNMAFDIPVKIFSFHLMLMGIVLLAFNAKRFTRASILGKAVQEENSYPIHSKEAKKVIRIVKASVTVLIIAVFVFSGFGRLDRFQEMSDPTLKGVWEVQTFIKNGVDQPLLVTNDELWRYVIVDYTTMTSIKTMNGKAKRYSSATNDSLKSISFGSTRDAWDSKMTYSLEKDTLELSGVFENDSLQVKLIKKDPKDFNLTNRGFNWINEAPRNQ